MKVILLKDVKGIGKRNEIVEVKDGYATNFLLPRGLAVKESKGSIEVLDKQIQDKKAQDEKDRQDAIALAKKLQDLVIEFDAQAGSDGRMFGTISTKQIETSLKEKHNIVIDKRKIISKVSVDRFGYTDLEIELYKGVIGKIHVHVSERR